MRPVILRTQPFAPRGVDAKALTGPPRVELTWRDNSRNETRFVVQRATNAGFTQNLAKFPVGPNNGSFASPGGFHRIVTFTDDTVDRAATYYYRVLALNEAGHSGWAKAPPVTVP